jgi:hypothetical protein
MDGGTEAVISSHMEHPGKRLIVLEVGEVEALQTDTTSCVNSQRPVIVGDILRELAEIRIRTIGVI